jgi:hypothetical protein
MGGFTRMYAAPEYSYMYMSHKEAGEVIDKFFSLIQNQSNNEERDEII